MSSPTRDVRYEPANLVPPIYSERYPDEIPVHVVVIVEGQTEGASMFHTFTSCDSQEWQALGLVTAAKAIYEHELVSAIEDPDGGGAQP